ncbi:glutamic acid-rich protein isoform X2 [Apis florea]|uniref:glutamic acid-rich protein isoform X2 n=1 Tax=Apis florea TaxID=7463 RepID=UPI0012FEE44D|nr:glutamic acid-rich protein isoform X2 [Apis florea]
MEKFFVQCIANIKENELMYLSNLLNPVECLQLVQAIYEVTPMKTERRVKKYETLMNKDITGMSTLSKECLLNLEEWSQDFPTNAKPNGRTTMEMILRWLGRPDLAKYVRENHSSSIDYFDTENLADTLECPGHRMSKRHTPEKGKNAQAHKKKKKKKKKKNKKQKISKVLKNKKVGKAVAAMGAHAKVHMWQPKEDKDTFTDYLEWKDEVICSCTDMEDYCTGQCSICKENDYKHHVIDRRSSSSDDSVKELNFVVRKPKKKEKKRKRFTFFQNSCQNKKKEKEQEYRDRKKILENMIMKKHEQQKLLPMLPNDVCCKCCKCTVYIRDKILREKKAREKKARKKKEEKRRKKEKLRKAELRANNVCFRETCK